jgi:hypothetical protein
MRPHDTEPKVAMARVSFTQHGSAQELATALGSTVFEPRFWPEDVGTVTYELAIAPHRSRYQIGSTRADGRPIVTIGQKHDPGARLPNENWYEQSDLREFHTLVAHTDNGYRAALQRDDQSIQLLGYLTEPELVRAVLSLHGVMP